MKLLVVFHIILQSVLIWTIIHGVTLALRATKKGCDEIIIKLFTVMETNSDIVEADP